jgi:AcrR family transcriptional regulator
VGSAICGGDMTAEQEPEHLLPKRAPRQRAVQQRALDTIEAAIAETIRVIETEGEKAVRIADISAATGMSYGALYHHFGDRDGLIRAAQFARLRDQPRLFTGPLADAFDAIEDGQGDVTALIERIRSIARIIVDPARQKVRLVRISVLASSETRPDLRQAVVDLEQRIMIEVRDLVTRAQQLGLVSRQLDPLAVATFLEAVAFGVVLQEYFEQQPDAEAVAEVVFRAFASLVQPGS